MTRPLSTSTTVDSAVEMDLGRLFRRKRRYTYEEIRDIVMPVARECHVRYIGIAPPKSRRVPESWDFVDIVYYPAEGFTSDDFLRMEDLYRMFPRGQFSIYAARLAPMGDPFGIPLS